MSDHVVGVPVGERQNRASEGCGDRTGVTRSAGSRRAVEDDADPDVLETRVTHTRKSRNAFDRYNRGLHWERTCADISKLRIARGPPKLGV